MVHLLCILWSISCAFHGPSLVHSMVHLLCIPWFISCAFHGPSFVHSMVLSSRLLWGRTSVFLSTCHISLFCLWLAALSAAVPALREVFGRCDDAKVSCTVTSHTSGLSCVHGISVAPSSHFPSSSSSSYSYYYYYYNYYY